MGQAAPNVLYTARASGYSVLLTSNKALLTLTRHANPSTGEDAQTQQSTVSISLAGASTKPKTRPLSRMDSTSNYFIGDNPKHWHIGVPNYATVSIDGVYPGIDMVYHGDNHRLEYDFVVAPGSDPNRIGLSIEGAERVRIDSGDLVIETPAGSIRQLLPLAYQETTGARQEVACSYQLIGSHRVHLVLGPYDQSRQLVIDPVIDYTTYLGGSGYEDGFAVAADATGNAYVVGDTTSTDFPVSSGALQSASGASTEAFVTKFDPTGAMIFSTYFGGTTSSSTAFAVGADSGGNTYVAGTTSGGIPVTAGSFQNTYQGGGDAFVFKLDPSGSTLIYSTYVGGTGDDEAYALAVDPTGRAFIGGRTYSTDLPVKPFGYSSFQAANAGGADGFVIGLSPDGSSLEIASYLGGAADDFISGLALDTAGNIYLTGRTASLNFRTTAGAFQTAKSGPSWTTNAFVTKIGPGGGPIIYSTYLGGTGGDRAYGIAVDSAGNAYITGDTGSSDFPVTPGAFQTSFAGGPNPGHCFVAGVSANGSSMVYGTFLGGTGTDGGRSIAIDSHGNAVVVGQTASTDFPVTAEALQRVFGGGTMDAFLARIDPTGSNLLYSTYYGGGFADQAFGVAVDSANTAYMVGTTSSYDLPAVPGGFQSRSAGRSDAFLTKLSLDGTGYTISGTITNELGNPLHNVTVEIYESVNTYTETDVNGFYSIGSLPPGSNLTVTAFRSGFTPPSVSVTNLSQNQTINFSGPAALTISGKVVDPTGAPVSNMTLSVNTTPASTTTTTDANGNYTFWMLAEGGTYTVTPTYSYGTFSPVNATAGPLTGDVVLSNFTLYMPVMISGQIASPGGYGASGVTVTLTGSASQTTQTDGSGYYSFSNLPSGGSYTLTPSSSLYTFSPPSRTLTNVVLNQQQVNFTPLSNVEIFGHVGANLGGLSGITVSLSGAASATTQTDSTGSYQFFNLPQGATYTVTPSDPRYTFTPASQTFPNISNYQLQDFPATLNTYKISGLVRDSSGNPVSGATITLAGPQSGPTQTDSSGAYSFTGLSAGFNYTLTPSKAGYTFSPTSLTISNLASDQTANFTATLLTYSISGQVSLSTGGALAGVTVALSGPTTASATTDSQGNYSFTSIGATGNYTVTPSLNGYTFSPTSQSFSNLLANQSQNFTATRLSFSVSGQITDGTGAPISGVSITLTGNQTTLGTGTDATGNYTITGVPAAANYTITPSKTHYVFSPANSAINNLLSNSTANFTGTLLTHTISGTVNDGYGNGLAGVTLTLSGSASATFVTDATGNYSFGPLNDGGNYTVTPSKLFWGFLEPPQTFNNLSASQTASFIGLLNTYYIYGRVAFSDGAALSGLTVTATGTTTKSAVTDAYGYYTITGLTAGGNYTVAPADTAYNYAPPTLSFSYLTSDQQSANFTATRAAFSIGGQITQGGVPFAGVTVTLSITGEPPTVTVTDSSGNYSFSGVVGTFDYTVTPTKTYSIFTPASQTITHLAANQTLNFTATPQTFSISGQALIGSNGIPGVTITLSGGMSASTVTDSSGNYSFPGMLAGLAYTVTASHPSYTLTPSVTINALIRNETVVSFYAIFSISGQVVQGGSPLAGVGISLTGSAVRSAVTDSAGNYSFTGLISFGTYTVTPTMTFHLFSPSAQTIANPVADQMANFSATLQTFSISGQLTQTGGLLPSVTVALTGTTSGSTVSDSLGKFSFTGLTAGGNYTVTPSSALYRFSPPSQSFTNLSADQTTGFSGTVQIYSISGQVTQGGSPLSGVSINLNGSTTASAVTDSAGNYSFSGLAATGGYTVTPSKNLYTFSPIDQRFSSLNGNQTASFVATPVTYTISGVVMQGTTALSGALMTVTGTTTGSAVTDSSGYYAISGLAPGGTYTVTPSKTFYTFSPPSQTFANLSGGQGANFAATLVTFSISGHVTEGGSPLPGVIVTLNGTANNSILTDASGAYSFTGLPPLGNYTVTPTAGYFSFMPVGYSISGLSANQTADFIGARYVYQVSGVVADACSRPTAGVTMTLTHDGVTVTATTDSSGAYSFSSVQAGYSYSLTPSLAGNTFNPVSASFVSLAGNAAANFTTIPATSTSQVTLTADAYVRAGSNANNNYGNQNQLITQLASTAGNTFETYVMFDVGQHCTVSSVKLRLFGRLSNNNPLNVPVSAYSVANTAWTETGITWNNKPPEGSLLTTTTIANNTQAWYEWDITSYVQSELAAGRHIIAIALKNPSVTSNQAVFNSRQASSNKPAVVVTTP
jgi:hypothetical protein